MSDVIQGIDVIFKLLPQLKGLTGARQREFLTELLKPAYNSFEEIHEFYNGLILDCREQIVNLMPAYPRQLDEELTVEQLTSLTGIKEQFLRKRQQDESLRDALRQDAQQMFRSIKWPEERRFLASIAYYFLGRAAIRPSDEDLDREIEGVMEQGGNRFWDTPSIRLYNELRNERNFEKIIEMLDEARNALNQRYMNVRHHYRRLQIATVMKR